MKNQKLEGVADRVSFGGGFAAVLVLGSLFLTFPGCSKGSDAASEDQAADTSKTAAHSEEETPKDTLVVKGLYMRQPGDAALKACQKIATGDLVAVDLRKGLEEEVSEARKAANLKDYENAKALAEKDVADFTEWHNEFNVRYNSQLANYANTTNFDVRGNHKSVLLDTCKGGTVSVYRSDYGDALFRFAGKCQYQLECMRLTRQFQPYTLTTGYFDLVQPQDDPKAEPSVGRNWRVWREKTRSLDTTKARDKREQVWDDLKKELADRNIELADDGSYHRSRVLYRLTLQDVDGNAVSKKDFVKELVRYTLQRELAQYQKDKNVQDRKKLLERMKKAETVADDLLSWVEDERESNHVRFRVNPPDQMGKKPYDQIEIDEQRTSRVYGFLRSTPKEVSEVLITLASRLKLKVQWGVVTRAWEKPTETVTTITDFGDEMHRYVANKLKLFDDESGRCFFRIVPKTNGVEVAKGDVVKSWLATRGYNPPTDKHIIPPKNLIEIAVKQDGKYSDELKGLCFVWLDENDKVKETYFNEAGMARLFNAGDLSSEAFAQLLVKNYPAISDLRVDKQSKNLEGRVAIRTSTWIHKDPKGFQVKLFERACLSPNGLKYTTELIEKNPELYMGLSLGGYMPEKFFTIFAIKPESERKFD